MGSQFIYCHDERSIVLVATLSHFVILSEAPLRHAARSARIAAHPIHLVILSEVPRFAGESGHEAEGSLFFLQCLRHIQAFSPFSIISGGITASKEYLTAPVE